MWCLHIRSTTLATCLTCDLHVIYMRFMILKKLYYNSRSCVYGAAAGEPALRGGHCDVALRSLLLASGTFLSLINRSSTLSRSLVSPYRALKPWRSSARPPTHTGSERDHHLGVASSSMCELPIWLAEGSAAALKAVLCVSAEPRVLSSCARGAGTAWAARGEMVRARARAFVMLGNVAVIVRRMVPRGALLSRLISPLSRGPRGSYV